MMLPGSGVGFDRLFNGSAGMQSARMLEQLGLPPNLAEMAGAQIDASRGDMAGVQRLMMAATQGLSTGQMDGLFGKGLPPAGFVPRPLGFLGGVVGGAVGGALGGIPGALVGAGVGSLIGRGFSPFGSPFGGVSREAPFGRGFVGRSMERAMMQNPLFKAQMERQLGGVIIPDGRADGRLTVWRPPFNMVGGIMRNALQSGLMPNIGLASTFAGLALPMGGALAANAITGSILRGMQRMEGNVASFMHQMQGNDVGALKAELYADPNAQEMAKGMGVNLANASFEDVLFLLLMKYAKKKENDVLAKVKQLDQAMQKKADGGGGGGFLGGLLGGIGQVAGGVFGGPLGGMVGGLAGNALGGLLGGGGAQGGGGSTGLEGGELGGQMDTEKMSDTMKQQMMQKLMGDLQKLYEMLSNMIKSMHDMQMTPVRNLRG